MNTITTNAIIEQHLHGAYGVDFLNCNEDELLNCAKSFVKDGVTMFLPTLATAPVEILKRQIEVIRNSMIIQDKLSRKEQGAKIYGVNLEACFISAEKKGIHDHLQLVAPTVENFKLIEDEVIKIVTIAPELDKNYELTNYLKDKRVKVFAGHTTASDLSMLDGVTHIFNAMSGISHREKSTAVSAMIEDNIFCEIILDGYHVDYDVAKLFLRAKPLEKTILISDALPIAHSNKEKMEFCSKTIYLKDGKATDENGTIAGSSMLLSDIVKKVVQNGLMTLENAAQAASNSSKLFGIEFNDKIVWDESLNITDVIYG